MRTRGFYQKRLPMACCGAQDGSETTVCRFFYGVTAVTAESYGCVWHFQQRYAGDDVLVLPLGWMSGAIVNLNGR